MEAVMDRKEFFRRSGKAALVTAGTFAGTGSVVLLTEGCNAAQWLATLEKDLPTLITIATNVASIAAEAQGKGQLNPAVASEITAIGKDVSDGLTALDNTVATYKAATAGQQPQLLAEIIAGIGAVQGNLQALLNAAHIQDEALQATITGSVTLAMTTLLAIQTLLPPAPAVTTPVAASYGGPKTRIKVRRANVRVANPKNATLHDVLVACYNELTSANGYAQFNLVK